MATVNAQTSTQADSAPQGVFPPFQTEHFGSQLLWLAIAFIALYVLLARLVLPHVASIFEARRKHIEDDIGEAGRLKAESEAAIEAYEKALAAARAKAQAIATATREEFAAASEQKKQELEAGLAGKLAESERRIEATKTAAMANVRGIAVDAADAIVEELIGQTPDKRAVERTVDATLH